MEEEEPGLEDASGSEFSAQEASEKLEEEFPMDDDEIEHDVFEEQREQALEQEREANKSRLEAQIDKIEEKMIGEKDW